MAILNRLMKRINIPIKSFKTYALYATGEVVLIFAGITLSLWFSDWNEEKKDRKIEVNILNELRRGLVNDAEDIRYNIKTREGAQTACIKILSLMEQKSPYHDSLDTYFAKCFQVTGTMAKASPYENLKSRGLHTITNDSLRTRIIDLHDLSYTHIHQSEKSHSDLFFNFLVHFNATRFHSSNPWKEMKPVNYSQLMADKEYKYYLDLLIFYNDYILGESRGILKNIDELTMHIDKELNRLE
jgi:hypothetical protein